MLVEQGEKLLLQGGVAVGLARQMDEVERRFVQQARRPACAAAGARRAAATAAAGLAAISTSKPLDSNDFSPPGDRAGGRRRAFPQASAIMVTEPLTTFERYDFAEVSILMRDL